MKYNAEDNQLTIWLEKQIDSGNAEQVEQEIVSVAKEFPSLPLLLDAECLTYISSAGLRILLRLSKKQREPLRIRNVSRDIYEILEMTGFTQLMQIHRKMRELSVADCPVIGRGASGTVYRLDLDTIVKVFRAEDDLSVIEEEYRIARLAFLRGIPTVIPYDIVRVGEQYGSVFELAHAKNCHTTMMKHPEKRDEILDAFVRLIRTVHATTVEKGQLKDSREVYRKRLKKVEHLLPPGLSERIGRLISDMPEDLHVVHGDFHMKNVMFSMGEPLLIDLGAMKTGDPVFELAGLFVAYIAFSIHDPENSRQFFGCEAEVLRGVYRDTLNRYFDSCTPEMIEDYERRGRVLGYVRFLYLLVTHGYGGKEFLETRIWYSAEQLAKLVPEIDRLAISEKMEQDEREKT